MPFTPAINAECFQNCFVTRFMQSIHASLYYASPSIMNI